MASPGAKDVHFGNGHWLPAHALSFAGFRFDPGVGTAILHSYMIYKMFFIQL